MIPERSFLGIGWAFPPSFGSRAELGQVQMAANEQDIEQSLFIILSTKPGERIMQPGFGCGLQAFVFREISASLFTEMRDVIDRAILYFEPRITVNLISITPAEEGIGRLDIRIDYTVRATNNRSNMVYPFYLLEGSDVSQK